MSALRSSLVCPSREAGAGDDAGAHDRRHEESSMFRRIAERKARASRALALSTRRKCCTELCAMSLERASNDSPSWNPRGSTSQAMWKILPPAHAIAAFGVAARRKSTSVGRCGNVRSSFVKILVEIGLRAVSDEVLDGLQIGT